MQNVPSPALRSLLELANTLVRDSTALATESWDRDLAQQSHAAFERLADLAANLDLEPIRMAALDLYVYLSAFEGHIPPEDSELAEIRELALSLEHALGPYQAGEPEVISAAAQGAEGAPAMSASIGLLEMDPPPALLQMMTDHGVDVVRLASLEQVPKVIGADLPMAIIASTEQVAGLCRVLDGLAQRVPASSNVVVVGVGRGQTDDRLHAMLSGCELYLDSLEEPTAALRVLDLASPPGPPFRVLLVDDDEDTRVYLSVLLQQVGIEARAIGDPSKAEEEIADFKPDLLLVDLFMPDTDGVTLTMRLRERKDLLVLPIVFLSAEQSEQARMQAIRAGGDDYLTKPVRPRSLIAAVRSRIQRARGVRLQLAPAAEAASTAEFGRGRLRRGELLSGLHHVVGTQVEGVQALFAIRLDQADVLNQKLGQASSYELEQSIDLRLLDVLGADDAIALWQEFGFGALVRRDSPKALQDLAERLCKAVAERPFKIQGRDMQLTVSVGMALPPANAADLPVASAVDGWTSAAFAAVAIAHRLGGNRYDGVLENGPGGIPAERVLMIREAVKRSVSNANMVMEFQPILQLHGDYKGYYALLAKLRDHRAPLGGVPRAEFLEAARVAGSINAIDRHSLSHAFAALEDLRASGRAARISVPADLSSYDRAQLQWLHGLLSRNPALSSGLQLEFDARVLIARPALKGILSVLRTFKMGCVLDDAEADLEKIEWYLQLPVTGVRFPYAAINQIPADAFAKAIEPWKQAGRAVVVDRVDELTDVNRLSSLGVDYVQGDALAAASPRLELPREE